MYSLSFMVLDSIIFLSRWRYTANVLLLFDVRKHIESKDSPRAKYTIICLFSFVNFGHSECNTCIRLS